MSTVFCELKSNLKIDLLNLGKIKKAIEPSALANKCHAIIKIRNINIIILKNQIKAGKIASAGKFKDWSIIWKHCPNNYIDRFIDMKGRVKEHR